MPRRSAAVSAEPTAPTPRQRLKAAQRLAAGDAPAMAAALADIDHDRLRELLDSREPAFLELLAECRRLAAMPAAQREERQQGLAMDAIDLALVDGVAVTTSHFLRGSAAARASRREEALIQANRNLSRLLHTITHEQLDEYQNLGKPKPANDMAPLGAAQPFGQPQRQGYDGERRVGMAGGWEDRAAGEP